MFTGLIEAQGRVKSLKSTSQHLHLILEHPFLNLEIGESIAVNGVCLTAMPLDEHTVAFDISSETLSKTYFEDLKLDEEVNLERAVQSNSRMGGHYVTGHIDMKAYVIGFEHQENYVKLSVGGFNPGQMLYLIPKGSITINGVSLTINSVLENGIELMLVPHTLECTSLKYVKPGQAVNIEFDYLTRIIAHQLQYFLQHNFNINSLK
jgi:riboflavin synthase